MSIVNNGGYQPHGTGNKPSNPPKGIKHDGNKPRFDLIPPQAELELARVLEYGARDENSNRNN